MNLPFSMRARQDCQTTRVGNSGGPVIKFTNTNAYKTYRVLVTETRGDNTDAVQYS